jgi:DNA-binding NarL/FixJ family response regulator
MAPVRVLVADDSAVFRAVIADVVAETPGFELAGTADSGVAAVALAADTRPDLVLLDVRMPSLGGAEAARRIRELSPESVVVLVTASSGVSAGAHGLAVIDKRNLTPAVLAGLRPAAR